MVNNLSPELLRQYINEGSCPWCGKGGFKIVSLHTNHVHGISAYLLREMAELFRYSPTCTPEISKKRSNLSHNKINVLQAQKAIKTGKYNMSKAGKKSAAQRLAKVRSAEQRERASLAAKLKFSKPHPCPVCGIIIPKATPITCSTKCRLVVRQLTGKKRLGKKATPTAKENMRKAQKGHKATVIKPHSCPICGKIIPKATPITCSPECRSQALRLAQIKATTQRKVKIRAEIKPLIAQRCKDGEKVKIIADEYNVSPRYIRLINKLWRII